MLKSYLKKIIFICIIIAISFTIASVGAEDNHQISWNQHATTPEDLITAMGCCSVLIKVNDTHYVFAFRRDSSYAADIFIDKVNWHGINAIKQHKNAGDYAFHTIMTENGWIIGSGGLDDGTPNQNVEKLASEMVLNNNIDGDRLQNISQIKAQNGIGHFIIMNPNGTYHVTYYDGSTVDYTLNNGEYVCSPNRYAYYVTGQYSSISSDPVTAAATIETLDQYGLTRRDITVYDLTYDNETHNLTDVQIYASNDDGHVYNRGTESLNDDIIFNGTKYPGSDLPIAPKLKYLGNMTFGAEDILVSYVFDKVFEYLFI